MESQEDSGNGFSDIILSKTFEGKAVILEFKKCKTGTPKAFKNMCQDALKQIEKNKYEYRYRASGYQEIIKYGIAFYGKGCLVIKKQMSPFPNRNSGLTGMLPECPVGLQDSGSGNQ